MLALKIQPGTIARQTIVINGELTYTLTLTAERLQRRPFILKITAQTLLGPLVVNQERFGDLVGARTAFTAYLNDISQK